MITTGIKTEGKYFYCSMSRETDNDIKCIVSSKNTIDEHGCFTNIINKTASKEELIAYINDMIEDLQEIVDFYGRSRMDMLLRTDGSF